MAYVPMNRFGSLLAGSAVASSPSGNNHRSLPCKVAGEIRCASHIAEAFRETAIRLRVKCDCRSDLLDSQGEHAADAAIGLDDPGRTRVNLKLAAEPKDLCVDHSKPPKS